MGAVPISPLSLNQLTRDTWGAFDPLAIAQVAPLADEPCYTIKFYKAPQGGQSLFSPNDFQAYGLEITPGSIIYGLALSCNASSDSVLDANFKPPQFTVQITDVGLKRKWYDEPLSSLFLSNYKPTGQLIYPAPGGVLQAGSFYNLLQSPYPVVGPGLFLVEITETGGVTSRIQLVFAVLEVCNPL